MLSAAADRIASRYGKFGGGEAIYAVIRTGGKQFRVEPGQVIDVERLPVAEGQRLELADVLLVADGAAVSMGSPTVAGAKVVAEVMAHGRQEKVVVLKYKAKTRHRTKRGHRQPFTRLAIREIYPSAEAAAAAAKPATARRRTRAADSGGKAEGGQRRRGTRAKAEAPVAAKAPVAAEEKPAHRPRRGETEARARGTAAKVEDQPPAEEGE
ncbi:MAG: 50S ribosomal protein L21 [Dehalococcoidia bacterium]